MKKTQVTQIDDKLLKAFEDRERRESDFETILLAKRWASAKEIQTFYGVKRGKLESYVKLGFVRSAAIVEPGKTQGLRLYNAVDVRDLIERSIINENQAAA